MMDGSSQRDDERRTEKEKWSRRSASCQMVSGCWGRESGSGSGMSRKRFGIVEREEMGDET